MDIKKFIKTIPEIKGDCDIYVNNEGDLIINIDDKTTVELRHGLFDCDNCYFSDNKNKKCLMKEKEGLNKEIKYACATITKKGDTGIWIKIN